MIVMQRVFHFSETRKTSLIPFSCMRSCSVTLVTKMRCPLQYNALYSHPEHRKCLNSWNCDLETVILFSGEAWRVIWIIVQWLCILVISCISNRGLRPYTNMTVCCAINNPWSIQSLVKSCLPTSWRGSYCIIPLQWPGKNLTALWKSYLSISESQSRKNV